MFALMMFFCPGRGWAAEHQLTGYGNGFYSQNYGTYGFLGQDAGILGSGITSTLTGPVLNRRLLRYTLGGRYSQGWSLGLADRVRLFDRGILMGLSFLPENWYTLGLFAEVGKFETQDGPLHTMQTTARGFGADLSIRPTRNLPTLYNRYADQTIDTDYLNIERGEHLRSYSARSTYHLGKNSNMNAAYDWSLAEQLESDTGYRNQRAYLQTYGRLGTETSYSILGSGNWIEADANTARRSKSTGMALRSYFYQHVDDRNDYSLTQNTDVFRNDGYEATVNSLLGLWNHQYTSFLRFTGGAEFAQTVTSGGRYELTYNKFRETGIAGFDLRIGDADFEITPAYQGRFGAVQVAGLNGGTFWGHSAALPLAFNAMAGLPMSLAGFYNIEGDNSEVPVFQRYRSVNFRADTYSARSERGTFTTHIYLDAQRSRNDGKIMLVRNQRDESRLGLTSHMQIRPFDSQFGTGYGFSRVETLDSEFDVHHVFGSWAYAPTDNLRFLNQIDWSRIVYPRGEPVHHTGFRSEGSYYARKLEFLAAYRYDDFGGLDGSSWGVFFEVRRHFAIGI